ncbi:phosphoinositide 3-kinase regulatory subunit 4 [Sporormia fimetaria CBS 119925]|uniref:non-specific serine/threonine protein kinase n=1 Tax=Sporormia fimetaria CBS 119925 TaxID=1340428 RepID=A0A6A6VIW5_9PLEO|nr:phosphoinositide 3-kinase regulatory subunit 4 [Sporormia fimetaria CBS 119925]
MGQGFSLTTLSAGAAGIDVPELSDLQYEKNLGAARFMKTVRARHRDGLVVARIVMKPYANLNLDKYVKRLLEERKLLADVPNALAYHRVIETGIGGYLVRQYIHSSLYDRLSTRPFLEEIEKKWLSFQLLCAVRDCHARNIYHGDIKTENVLVTSWNWLYLTDFSSSYKPVYLPEDNPADFSFYFDMSGRRTCYLAPERFLPPGEQPEGEHNITWAMDIFSVGCVIAELFLEAPIFSLSQLFRYRQREYDPTLSHLSKIHDPGICELVSHMIKLDPSSRLSAEEYLRFWEGKAFPTYFYGFLHQYMHSLTDPASGQKPVTTTSEHLGEPDDRIEQIYSDFDKISVLLVGNDEDKRTKPSVAPPKPNDKLFPLTVDIPNYQHRLSPTPSRSVDDGNLIFLTTVVSCIRGTARASARLRGFELLLGFSERLTDEAKLDRVVPYIATLLQDRSDQVKVGALRTLTQILANVQVVTPINAYVFPEYILQRLEPYLPDSHAGRPSSLVRMHYAWCIGTLATTAGRYLDLVQALRTDGSLSTADVGDETLSSSIRRNQFDSDRQNLLDAFEKHTKALLTDPETSVRRAMLRSVSDLCVFFGSPRANDVVLSHLNTYLNDPDWMLKCAFFDAIVGVAIFVGGPGLEGYILPLMVQALTDPEEFVVEKVIRAFSSMAELGLFQRSKTWELVDIVARLTMHPNIWIREAAAQFISQASKYLSVADTHSILVNLVRPYLRVIPADFSELRILDSLKKPLPRLIMDMASNWAVQPSQKGLFWAAARQQRTFSFGSSEDTLPTISGRELDSKVLQRLPKNEEDELWLRKLRSAGMSSEDEFKLVSLREFIWRVSQRRKSDAAGSTASEFNKIVALKDLGIIPETVLFESNARQVVEQVKTSTAPQEPAGQPRTIADALKDAAAEADDGSSGLPASTKTDDNVRDRSQSVSLPAQSRPSSSPKVVPIPKESTSLRPETTRRSSLQVPRSSPGNQSTAPSIASSARSALRHEHSALGLLKGENKAAPETGTSDTTAIGRVDGVAGRAASQSRQTATDLAVEQRGASSTEPRFKDAHNYKKNNPTVLKLLDSMLSENLPPSETEFGPLVQLPSQPEPVRYKDSQQSKKVGPWRPEGVLMATFSEHTAAVTRVLVAPDYAFFITGSDDGTVKVWDTSRLERNVSRKSRQTFKLGDNVRVSSLTFLEQSYCYAVTGTDGSVHVVKINYFQGADGAGKFARHQVLREHQLPEGDVAVWSEHYMDGNKSVLMLATNTSKIIALDLRNMSELFTLRNPLNHGTPTCFCVDRRHQWLMLGTSHGVLCLWDLRFKLLLKSWVFHGASPIHRIVRCKNRKMYITGGTGQGEITAWDFDTKDMGKLVCKEIYRTGHARDTGSKSTTVIDLDNEEGSGGMLGRFSTTLEPSASAAADQGIRALAVHWQFVPGPKDPRQTFLLSAGPDWKVRYWDPQTPASTTVVNGLEVGEAKPVYSASRQCVETLVVNEQLMVPSTRNQGAGSSSARESSSRSSTTSSRRSGGQRIGKSALLVGMQQQLLRGHVDLVTDVAVLEVPYGMVVSADRSGVVCLWM